MHVSFNVLCVFCMVAVYSLICAFGCDSRQEVASECNDLARRLNRNPNDEAALNRLVNYLEGDWSFASVHAAGALGEAGPAALPALPSLIKATRSHDNAVRRAAIQAIGRVSVGRDDGVDPLIHLLSVGPDSAFFAAKALGDIGPAAKEAISELERLRTNSDSAVALAAEEALQQIAANR